MPTASDARTDPNGEFRILARGLDPFTASAARAFMRRLPGEYAVAGGVVFGSRARGDYRVDSDADIAVILKGQRGDRYKVAAELAGIAFDVMMETGVLVDPLPLWEGELKNPEAFSNPKLIWIIIEQGLPL